MVPSIVLVFTWSTRSTFEVQPGFLGLAAGLLVETLRADLEDKQNYLNEAGIVLVFWVDALGGACFPDISWLGLRQLEKSFMEVWTVLLFFCLLFVPTRLGLGFCYAKCL